MKSCSIRKRPDLAKKGGASTVTTSRLVESGNNTSMEINCKTGSLARLKIANLNHPRLRVESKQKKKGPKVKLVYLKPKDKHVEESPANNPSTASDLNTITIVSGENERDSDMIQELKKTLSRPLRQPVSSMANFYFTNSSQLAKEEDDFWRYQREFSIIDRQFRGSRNGKDSLKKNWGVGMGSGCKRSKSILRLTKKWASSTGKLRDEALSKNVSFNETVEIKKILSNESGVMQGWLKF